MKLEHRSGGCEPKGAVVRIGRGLLSFLQTWSRECDIGPGYCNLLHSSGHVPLQSAYGYRALFLYETTNWASMTLVYWGAGYPDHPMLQVLVGLRQVSGSGTTVD